MHVTGFRRHYTRGRTGFIRNAGFDLTLKLPRNESSRFLLCAVGLHALICGDSHRPRSIGRLDTAFPLQDAVGFRNSM